MGGSVSAPVNVAHARPKPGELLNERGFEIMKYEVIADNEWIYEGSYEVCEKIAFNYWSDPDFYGFCTIMTEAEFYGEEE